MRLYGGVKYIYTVTAICIPLYLVDAVYNGKAISDIVRMPFIISLTPFWFIRTYFFLYILSPVINKFLLDITLRLRIYLILALVFISIYCGSFYFLGGDQSLIGGKHIINFLLWYVIGNTLRQYKNYWMRFNVYKLSIIWLVVNTILVVIFSSLLPNRILNGVFDIIFFQYSSIGLLFNAILFFIIVGHLKFSNKVGNIINKMAKASLLIYILHCSNFVFSSIIKPLSLLIFEKSSSIVVILLYQIVLSVLIVISCCFIYRLLYPVWSSINNKSTKHADLLIKNLNSLIH